MVVMKRFLLSFALAAATLGAADLANVRTVYLLPMARGLDQYLANRLTNDGVFQVVTDVSKADAIFTERIGEAFEQKMDELLPPPAPPEPAKAEPKAEEHPAPATSATDARGDLSPIDEPVNKIPKAGSMSTISRARGTIFLVDAKTKQVIWSAYELPKDGSSKQMDQTASNLVHRLKKLLAPPSK